jgi:hypothetical protein
METIITNTIHLKKCNDGVYDYKTYRYDENDIRVPTTVPINCKDRYAVLMVDFSPVIIPYGECCDQKFLFRQNDLKKEYLEFQGIEYFTSQNSLPACEEKGYMYQIAFVTSNGWFYYIKTKVDNVSKINLENNKIDLGIYGKEEEYQKLIDRNLFYLEYLGRGCSYK